MQHQPSGNGPLKTASSGKFYGWLCIIAFLLITPSFGRSQFLLTMTASDASCSNVVFSFSGSTNVLGYNGYLPDLLISNFTTASVWNVNASSSTMVLSQDIYAPGFIVNHLPVPSFNSIGATTEGGISGNYLIYNETETDDYPSSPLEVIQGSGTGVFDLSSIANTLTSGSSGSLSFLQSNGSWYTTAVGTWEFTVAPEPGAIWLGLFASVGFVLFFRRRLVFTI